MAVCTHCATPLPDGSRFCAHCGTPTSGRDSEGPALSSPQSQELFDRLEKTTEGQYELISEIGRGGMAVVFLGYQMSLDRYIAIKVLLPFLAFDTGLVERFLREARTQGRLDHPSIIKVYEVYDERGLTFFTMPFVSGDSLRTLLDDEPRPSLARVHRYLCQAADALAYAHKRGVIHRDVKPDNMLLDRERDCIILTDFGIAKALSAETTLTTPGDLLGTPHYMSPEQGEGKHDLDGRTDQYSLGLVGWEMLAGRRPFEAANLAELMYRHRFEDPDRLEVLRPDVPAEMREAVTRAIRKNRDDRYPTMDEFLAALQSCAPEVGELEETATESAALAADGATTNLAASAIGAPDAPGAADPGAASEAGRGSAGRARRGKRLWLAVGGVAALLAAGALLSVGPLRSLLPRGGDGAGTAATQPAAVGGGADSEAVVPAANAAEEEPGPAGDTDVTPGDEVGAPAAAADAVDRAREDSRPGGAGTRTADEEARALALAQQARAFRAQQAAIAAGASDIFGAELARLNSQLRDAGAELEGGLFDQARSHFVDLSRDYAALTQKSMDARENGGLEAVAARHDMEEVRRAAVEAGLRQRAPLAFTAAAVYAGQARGQFDAGNYGEAASLYQRAGRAYQDLLERVADQPGTAERAGAPVSAEEAVSGLVDRFGELFASEDLRGMGAELYQSEPPEADRQLLEAIFARADEISVTRLDRNLRIDGTSATADVRLRMRFRQARTRSPGERDMRLEMTFAEEPDGWRLTGLRPRR